MSEQTSRRVSDLNVQVRDGRALQSVKPEAMVAYLEREGHGKGRERLREGTLIGYDIKLEKPLEQGRRWAFAPARADYADYAARVGDFVRDLAEADGRSQLAVLLELLGVDEPLPLLPA